MDSINLTPTWSAIMPALLDIVENGTAKGKKEARAELQDLAKKVDAANAVDVS